MLRRFVFDLAMFWLGYHEGRARAWRDIAEANRPPFTLDGRR